MTEAEEKEQKENNNKEKKTFHVATSQAYYTMRPDQSDAQT